MSLKAPFTVYVDEAGSPDFCDASQNGTLKAYIPCAVGVYTLKEQEALNLLPVDSLGNPMKASDPRVGPSQALEFAKCLLATDCEIAAILIDPAGNKSVAAARSLSQLSSQRRQALHRRRIRPANLGYSLFVARVVCNLLEVTLLRRGKLPSYVDLVLDEAILSRTQKTEFAEGLKQAGHPKIRFGRVDWCHEKDEPLLLLPDHVAGILHRQATRGDQSNACVALLGAAQMGRIAIQDGYTTKTTSGRADLPCSGE